MNLDEYLNKISKSYEIVAGYPKDKQFVYPDDDRKRVNAKGQEIKGKKGGQTVAQVANWNEYGTKTKIGNQGSPARPFIREAFRKNKTEIDQMIRNAISAKNLGDVKYLHKIGLRLVAMIQDSIVNGDWKPNAISTAINKSSFQTRETIRTGGKGKKLQKALNEITGSKPLIDRGFMRKATNYEVREI